MTQHYSDPEREDDPYALPNIEVFYSKDVNGVGFTEPGWYWWACFPGCLPDSDPMGPYDTEAEALADAQDAGE